MLKCDEGEYFDDCPTRQFSGRLAAAADFSVICKNNMYASVANLLEIIMVGSIFVLLLTHLYMKYLLSRKGCKVHWLFDYGRNYRNFKTLIESEINDNLKHKYKGILFILKASAITLVMAAAGGVLLSQF